MNWRYGKVTSLAAALALSAGAAADTITVIYTKIPGHPTSVIPGTVDLNGDPVSTNWRALEDIAVSPDGTQWVIKGRTQLGTPLETILVYGSGNSGTMYAQKSQPVHGGATGEVYDFFGSGLGRFNDNNDFAFSARAMGGVNSVFQKVLVRDFVSGNTSIAFQMGDLISGLIDQAPNPSGDEIFGNSVGSIHILNNGDIGSQDSTIVNIHSSRRPAIMYNQDAFHQTNVTSVLSLDGMSSLLWTTISANTFYTSPDGANWIATGRVNTGSTATDDVLVYNGQVAIQEGMPIGSSGINMVAVFASGILSNGDWYARGSWSGGVWAAINGEVVAKTGDPIYPGSSLVWGSSFYSFAANTNGDWVLSGRIVDPDATDVSNDDLLVLNGERIVLREGDPIDLDGNGVFDDNVFVGRGNNTLSAFEPNDINIDNNGDILIFINIRDAAVGGTDLNSDPAFGTPQAFLRISTASAPGCPADLSGSADQNDPAYGVPDGVVDSSDFFYYLDQFVGGNLAVADLTGSSDPNDPDYGVPDGVIDAADFFFFLDIFSLGCP
ncbi:MAG: hypothetical protein KIT24_07380 [Phycisphaeraceae bacterium]|nr:hypothetical protein [Phycisphaeraceae bacterium]